MHNNHWRPKTLLCCKSACSPVYLSHFVWFYNSVDYSVDSTKEWRVIPSYTRLTFCLVMFCCGNVPVHFAHVRQSYFNSTIAITQFIIPRDRFKNTRKLLNLRALHLPCLYKIHISMYGWLRWELDIFTRSYWLWVLQNRQKLGILVTFHVDEIMINWYINEVGKHSLHQNIGKWQHA